MVTLDNIHQSKVIQIKNIDANKCQIELNELIDKRKDILKSTESNATELMLINEKKRLHLGRSPRRRKVKTSTCSYPCRTAR